MSPNIGNYLLTVAFSLIMGNSKNNLPTYPIGFQNPEYTVGTPSTVFICDNYNGEFTLRGVFCFRISDSVPGKCGLEAQT